MSALTRDDLQMFEKFHIPAKLLEEAGVQRVTHDDAKTMGFCWTGPLDGILFPYVSGGKQVNGRVRRDRPERGEGGKPENKYVALSKKKGTRCLYSLPNSAELMKDDSAPIVFVEAEKSVLALAALFEQTGQRILPIATGGCWGWRTNNGKDGSLPLPDFESITWKGRRVFICFDSDVATNPKVQSAEAALVSELQGRGADVRCIRLPQEPGVNGPDDYIAGHSDNEFLQLLEQPAPADEEYERVRKGLGLKSMADVTPKAVRWLWDGRIPLGNITFLNGDPGQGKSAIIASIASRVSRGAAGFRKGKVLMLIAEDNVDDTVKPRLLAAGADCSQIMFVSRDMLLTPEGLRDIRTIIRNEKPILLTIDPLFAFVDGKVDTHRDNQSRSVLSPLKGMAEECGIAILCLRHLNKGTEGKAIYRGGGSIAFTAAARAEFFVGNDPNKPGHHVMGCSKINNGPKPPALGYVIESISLKIESEEIQGAMIRWTGETNVDEDEVLGTNPKDKDDRSAVDEASEFLRGSLEKGPVARESLFEWARPYGITESALRRAKTRLGIVSRCGGFQGEWFWELPAQSA